MKTPNLVPAKRISNFLRAQGVERPQNFGKFTLLENVQPTMEISNFDWMETQSLAEQTGIAVAGAQNDCITIVFTRGAHNTPLYEYIWTNKIWLECTAETTPCWVYITPYIYAAGKPAYPFAGSTFGFLGTNAENSIVCAYADAVLPPDWIQGVRIIPYGGAIDVTVTMRMDYRIFST